MTGDQFSLAYPWVLAAMLILPAISYLRRIKKVNLVRVPHAANWLPTGRRAAPPVWKAVILYTASVLLIFAASRPQKITLENPTQRQGYDIILAIDLSGSMLAEDAFRNGQRINRLRAILPVIQRFVRNRRNDRIGVVVFAGRAYTLANLTMHHDWLEEQIGRLGVEHLEDGTAIGDALGIAVSRLEQKNRLEEGKRPGAFIVLLTDGANNSGHLQPMQSAELAARRGIPVFTIAVGREGIVPFPVFDRAGRILGYENRVSEIDFDTMKNIAQLTGGKFYHAEDAGAADSVFAQIDKATPIRFVSEKQKLTTEEFHWFALPGLMLLWLSLLINKKQIQLTREATA
jgi:Ca-activated chloride channel family protein